jgi:heat shock protein HslJ
MKQIIIPLLLFVTLLGAGCGGTAATTPVPTPAPATPRGEALPLDETRWELNSVRGVPLAPDSAITIRFVNNDELAGEVDCNSYGSTYSAGGASGFRLTGRIHRTAFDCARAEDATQQEAAYYGALQAAGSYGVTGGEPAVLTFYDAAGTALLTFHERQAPVLDSALADDWVLASLDGAAPLPGTQIRLSFSSDRYDALVDGYAGCNLYGGTLLTASDGRLQVGEVAFNARDCQEPPGVMLQEAAYSEALNDAASYAVSGDRLMLEDRSGGIRLTFTRQAEGVADAAALPGTAWRLISAGDDAPEAETMLVFLDSTLGLARYDGCAGYLYSYRAGGEAGTGDDLTIFGSQALPNEGCDDPGAALDTVLPDTYVHNFRLEDGMLALLLESGDELVYEPLAEDAGLAEGEWVLLAFVTIEDLDIPFPRVMAPQPDVPPRLRFEDGLVRGNAGCNYFAAAYEAADGSLAVGELEVTEEVCEGPAELMAQQERFLAGLAAAGRAVVAGDVLWVETGADQALLFGRVEVEAGE